MGQTKQYKRTEKTVLEYLDEKLMFFQNTNGSSRQSVKFNSDGSIAEPSKVIFCKRDGKYKFYPFSSLKHYMKKALRKK